MELCNLVYGYMALSHDLPFYTTSCHSACGRCLCYPGLDPFWSCNKWTRCLEMIVHMLNLSHFLTPSSLTSDLQLQSPPHPAQGSPKMDAAGHPTHPQPCCIPGMSPQEPQGKGTGLRPIEADLVGPTPHRAPRSPWGLHPKWTLHSSTDPCAMGRVGSSWERPGKAAHLVPRTDLWEGRVGKGVSQPLTPKSRRCNHFPHLPITQFNVKLLLPTQPNAINPMYYGKYSGNKKVKF